MSRIVDGLREPTTVFEAAVWHHCIKVRCARCPNSAIFDAAGVWWHLMRRNGDIGLRDLHHLFYCFACSHRGGKRVRPHLVDLVKDEPTRILPDPDQREWKRALSRFKT